MQPLFSSTFFAQNRRKLRRAIEASGPIVVAANGLLQRTADTTLPFQQESNFWYLTGINQPDLVLVMDAADEYIIVPGRSDSREIFDGALDTAAMSQVSRITTFIGDDEGWQRLGAQLKTAKTVLALAAAPAYIEQYGMYVNPARARLLERVKSWQPDIEMKDIREAIVNLRSIKQPQELAAIQKAIDITATGLNYVTSPRRLLDYQFEFEIESDLTRAFRTQSSSGHSFAPIVAGGKRACTLHNVENSAALHQGDLLVLDVGAEVSHYAADITRTVALGAPSQRQKDVFAAVLDVQAYAGSLLKPGVLLKEYESEVETFMGEALQRLGLIRKTSPEAIRRFFPHATSHFLGLDVHDVGDYQRPLEPGMVLTVEPGIYIAEEAIGVRIEDDVLVTGTGIEYLSAKIPKSLTAND